MPRTKYSCACNVRPTATIVRNNAVRSDKATLSPAALSHNWHRFRFPFLRGSPLFTHVTSGPYYVQIIIAAGVVGGYSLNSSARFIVPIE